MKTFTRTTALILVLALAGGASAGELPAQAQRIWAPTGDLIGLQNHATVSFLVNDQLGDTAKFAEDWSDYGETMGTGLFGYHRVSEDSYRVTSRGHGGNREGSGFTGDLGVWSSSPGSYAAAITYSRHHAYSDRDVELRNPGFPAPPPPAALAFDPRLEWSHGRVDLRFHLADWLDVRGGFVDLRRNGRKASLLRTASGETPPTVLRVDNAMYEIYAGAAFRRGKFAGDLELSYRGSDTDRDYEAVHRYDDERQDFRASLDATYDVASKTRVFAHGTLARLELEGNETWSGREGSSDGDTEHAIGQLAVLTTLGQATTVRASARFQSEDTETRFDEDGSVLHAAERDRSRQDWRLSVANTSLPRTRLKAHYRYGKSDLDEVVARDGMVGSPQMGDNQSVDEERTRQDMGLRARTRLSRAVKLDAELRYTSLEVDQATSWETADEDPWFGILGDHERDRLMWNLAFKTRPLRNLPVDFGYQGRDQTLERTDEGTETTWTANRLFLNANWLATGRLSVYGMLTYGQETYELTGVGDPAAGFAAFDYDGATLRMVPGAMLQLSRCLRLEGMYEFIDYENTGSETDNLLPVEADHDRMLVRVRWQATEKLAAAFTYRRNEFDENRWDDYIRDLYAVSLSGVF
jgi:hypothetical protein